MTERENLVRCEVDARGLALLDDAAWARLLRRGLVLLLHATLFVLAYVAAALLRLDFAVGDRFREALGLMPIVIGLQLVVFILFGTHRGWMGIAGLQDLVAIVKSSVVSFALIVVVLALGWRLEGVSRSILILDLVCTVLFLGCARLATRLLREVIQPTLFASKAGKRLIILGAGSAGAQLVSEIQRNPSIAYDVRGFFDDDRTKLGSIIQGVRVLGTIDALPGFIEPSGVEEVIIAIPSATGLEMRRIVEICRSAGVPFRRLPALEDLVSGRVTVSQLREVKIEDLLRREPVALDHSAIHGTVAGRTIMVTGAAGSIGSEICRQLARFQPRGVLLVDWSENGLFLLERELRRECPGLAILPLIASVTDQERMKIVFEQHRPDAVFHAAAHKHVPMMEQNPGEAVKNNVLGTKVVADLAHDYGCKVFVLISTDKAVNPTSVMGATKRLAELYLQSLAHQGTTRYMAVRFGNVLGSNGSVVPIFQDQIRRGASITVTHPEMRRYFMIAQEAAQLVLQAASLGRGGEVFVLDMGDPVRIVDLARDLIRLSGLSDDEIPIEFSGLRPGEKLFEEIALTSEAATKTRHPKIWIGRVQGTDRKHMEAACARLTDIVDGPREWVLAELRRLVPEYGRWARGAPELPAATRARNLAQAESRPRIPVPISVLSGPASQSETG